MNKNTTPDKCDRYAHPLAFLIFSFLYYFLATALHSAVGGISMASVEGVATYPSLIERLSAISPVFVYLAGWVFHAIWEYRKHDTFRIRRAVTWTFNAHLGWFGICVLAWVACGSPPIYTFDDTAIGGTISLIGSWLTGLLLVIFGWTWAAGLTRERAAQGRSQAVRA